MFPLSYRPRPSSSVTIIARSFRTTTGVDRRAVETKRYKLDRQWELSRKPAQRWSIFHGFRIRIRGVVSLFSDDKELQAWREMPKAAFYAVKVGNEPGIYSTWAECERQVKGFAGAKYKKFGTREEAEAFVQGTSPHSQPNVLTSTIGQQAKAEEAGDSHMLASATSPMTLAPPKSLPDQLGAVARQGYSFTTAPHHLIVYTDGSSLNNGKTNARAGLGVYYGYGGRAVTSNISERVPGILQTNNRGELLSVIRALEDCPYPDLPLEIRTDSQYTIKCMTGWLPGWARKQFAGVKNADMIKHMLVLLRRRSSHNKVVFKYVAGHSGEIGNEEADALARRGAMKEPLPDREDWLNPDDVDEEDVPPSSEVAVEVDENWLLSEADLAELEKEFSSP